MALLTEGSRCSICDGELDRPYMGLPDGAKGMPRELWDYCDSIVHLDCFEQWEHRQQFSEICFKHEVERFSHPSHWLGYLLARGESWAVICGPTGPHTKENDEYFNKLMRQFSGDRIDYPEPFYASVILRDWVTGASSNWFNWDEVVNGGFRKDKPQGKALADLEVAMIEVKKAIPDLKTLYQLLQRQIDSKPQE